MEALGQWQQTVGLVAVALFLATQHRRIRDVTHAIVSGVIHYYLCWRYPIHSTETGAQIPTCPYSWPDGQGNVAKFLEGQTSREGWTEKYGSVYRIWNGMKPEIIVSNPSHLQTVYKSSDKHKKAENINSGWLFQSLMGDCLGLISGHRWKNLRNIWEESFTYRYVADNCKHFEDISHKYMDKLPCLQGTDKGLINASEDLKLLSFFIVAEKLYGPLSPEMEDELRNMVPEHEILFHKAITGGFTRFWWTKKLPTETKRMLDDFQGRWIAFNKRAYERAMANVDNWPLRPDIISIYGAVLSGEIPEKESLQTMYEVLMGNLDVTLGALSWALVFIVGYNQDAIRKEIEEARSTNDPAKWSEYILSTSSLIQSSILESSRLKPLAAFSVPQAPDRDHVLDGYKIPAGTDFVIDSRGVNITNQYWGKDSEIYRPERFQQQDISKARYNYWRFGFGPRFCLGKYLSDVTIKSSVIYLLERYNLRLEGETANHDSWNRVGGVWITQANITLGFEKR